MRATAVIAAIWALTAGCGLVGGDGDGSSDDSSAPATVDADRLSPSDLPEAPTIKDGTGAVSDVQVRDCPSNAGKNEVEGSVTNSADDVQDYVITISWITPQSDVMARGVTVVKDVPAGESKDWKLTGTALAKSGSYTCTTHVMRGRV